MIFVTQGHQKAIGLEIFLKSFLLLSKKEKELFILVVEKKTLTENLSLIRIPFLFTEKGVHLGSAFLKCSFIIVERWGETW